MVNWTIESYNIIPEMHDPDTRWPAKGQPQQRSGSDPKLAIATAGIAIDKEVLPLVADTSAVEDPAGSNR